MEIAIAQLPADEASLVERARARDPAAIRAIVEANNGRLYRLARGILRNESEAEDVVQETYLRAFSHFDSFRGDAKLSTWLSRIAINEALGRIRVNSVRPPDRTLDPATEAQIIPFPSSTADNPEVGMAQRQIQRVVEDAIDALPDTFRVVFIARVIEAMSIEETAVLFDLKPETVKTRLHRARSLLRTAVEREIGPLVLDAFPFGGRRCARLTETVVSRFSAPILPGT